MSGFFITAPNLVVSQPFSSSFRSMRWNAGAHWLVSMSPQTVSIAHGLNRYVGLMFGTYASYVWTSPDGKVWTPIPLPSAMDLRVIRFSGGRFTALGSNAGVATNIGVTSVNGTTWVQQDIEVTNMFYSMAVADGIWLTTGTDALFRSTTGSSFAAVADPKITMSATARVAGATGKGFVLLSGTNQTTTAWSPDGTAWTLVTMPGVAAVWSGIAYVGDRFVAAVARTDRVAWSQDGQVWVQSTMPVAGTWVFGFTAANGLYTATDSATGRSYTTRDFVNWTDRGTGSRGVYELMDAGLRLVSASTHSTPFAVSLVAYDPAVEFALPDIQVPGTGNTPLNYYIKVTA